MSPQVWGLILALGIFAALFIFIWICRNSGWERPTIKIFDPDGSNGRMVPMPMCKRTDPLHLERRCERAPDRTSKSAPIN